MQRGRERVEEVITDNCEGERGKYRVEGIKEEGGREKRRRITKVRE